MALIKADRVKESSTSTGASTFALAGAYTGFRSFSSVCSVGDTFYYVIDSDLGSEWETGLGTYSAVNTLTRTTVHSSSNSNNIVTFSAGTKNVYISLTGNQLGTLSTLAGSETLTNKTINASNNTITNVSLTSGVTGTLPIANGGTGTTTAQLAINALAGAVTSGSYLRGNGTNVVMATISAGDVPTLNQNTTGTASGSVSGTASYLAKFTGTNVVGNSLIYDSGTNVGVGTASPSGRLHISATGVTEAKIEGTTASYLSFIRLGTNFGYVGLGSGSTDDIYIVNTGGGKIRLNSQALVVSTSNTIGINETIPGAQLHVATAAAATKGLIVKGASAQSANLQEWQNNAGTVLAYVDLSGRIYASGNFTVADNAGLFYRDGRVGIGTGTSTPVFGCEYSNYMRPIILSGYPDGAGSIGTIINTSNSYANATAKLLSVQSNGTEKFAIFSNGGIQPASMADSAATNNSIYYSTTASKLVYKDAAGTVNNLY
jgi:hypothetical protein